MKRLSRMLVKDKLSAPFEKLLQVSFVMSVTNEIFQALFLDVYLYIYAVPRKVVVHSSLHYMRIENFVKE